MWSDYNYYKKYSWRKLFQNKTFPCFCCDSDARIYILEIVKNFTIHNYYFNVLLSAFNSGFFINSLIMPAV